MEETEVESEKMWGGNGGGREGGRQKTDFRAYKGK